MSEKKEMKELVVQGTAYKTYYTKKFEQRVNWEAPDDRLLYSFIPGTIIDIYVKPKQKLKEGDVLLLLEAMKMQNVLRSMRSGVIKKCHAELGSSLMTDETIVEFED